MADGGPGKNRATSSPQVVIHLLPAGVAADVGAGGAVLGGDAATCRPCRNKRVHYLTDWFVLLPGYHLGDLAEQFALVLHPFANVGPLNQLTPSTTNPPLVRPLQRGVSPDAGESVDSSPPSR